MTEVGMSEARNHLAELIDAARRTGEPMYVTRRYRVEVAWRAVKRCRRYLDETSSGSAPQSSWWRRNPDLLAAPSRP